MTDKQIKEVFKNGFYCIEPCPEIKELKSELKAKEQECEELNKIIDEAKNSKLDLKSFLVGEAIQNEYEQQLDQLKAENEELKKDLDFQKNMYECARADEEDKFEEILELKQTLAEIKEIAEKAREDLYTCESISYADDDLRVILQKISEVEDDR